MQPYRAEPSKHWLPKETVGRVRAVLIEMLTNDNKEDEDIEDDDIEDAMYIN